jgi:uncharacterized protein (DUF2345 family)
MSYLSQPTSKTEYGVVQIGDYIDVSIDGIISNPQDLSTTADVTFSNANVTGNLTAKGNLVITSLTASAGPGISVSNVDNTGYDQSFTVNNTGVLSLTAGPGISLSANKGNITVSTTGADFLNTTSTNASYTASATDEYIGSTASSAITITLPAGTQGRVYTIKDENGGNPKITVSGSNGEKIDNRNSYLIDTKYQSISLVFRSTGWWLI